MRRKNQNNWNDRFFYGGLVLTIAVLLYAFLPVPYTILVQPNDGQLMPGDPVTPDTPFEQCFEGPFQNVTGLDLLLATYGRMNTSMNDVAVYWLIDGKKLMLRESRFSSAEVRDNDYFSVNFRKIPEIGTLCFAVTSPDATPENGITYWLNSQSQPVIKIRSTEPLHKAVEKIASASRFDLPMWHAVALCLLYLTATVGTIFFAWYEPQKNLPKTASPHPRRTRQKRV